MTHINKYIYIYIYVHKYANPPTDLHFSCLKATSEMQLFYLECPMRLDQHQLAIHKEVLFTI